VIARPRHSGPAAGPAAHATEAEDVCDVGTPTIPISAAGLILLLAGILLHYLTRQRQTANPTPRHRDGPTPSRALARFGPASHPTRPDMNLPGPRPTSQTLTVTEPTATPCAAAGITAEEPIEIVDVPKQPTTATTTRSSTRPTRPNPREPATPPRHAGLAPDDVALPGV